MAVFKCPGQDGRNIKAEAIICPACGYKAEIFSDEAGVRCAQCRGYICRQIIPSCVDWCRHAAECIGPEKWVLIKGGK